MDLGPLDVLEAPTDDDTVRTLWVRGGFPDSLLAADDLRSLLIRRDFIRTYRSHREARTRLRRRTVRVGPPRHRCGFRPQWWWW